MKKQLSDMTNEELWEIFPIMLEEHDRMWAERYYLESAEIVSVACAENIARINHIGSTAVPGLIAKPTIDMLLEVKESCDTEKLKTNMVSTGYLYTAQPNNPAPHMMFLKGYTHQGFVGQVYHVHVRYPGDWGELYFRDYLTKHRDIADEYGRLKTELIERFKYDRDGYTDAKTDFVNRYTALARVEYSGRYEIKS
jgi:GrpB-like predicted nucleotidyltransferase (UPF0157 family)